MQYPLFELGTEPSKEQLSFFEEYGFLHFRNFITKQTVASIIDESKKIEKKWIENGTTQVNGIPIKFGLDVDNSKIVQRFAFASLQSTLLHEFLKDSRFKTLFHLIEGDVRIGEIEKDGMVLNHYVNTSDSQFTQMGWHTDSLRDVFYGKKVQPMLNVGVHLDTTAKENGGLRIIPGTHKQSLWNILFRKTYFLDNKPDKEEVGLDIKAGDLTVHDGRLWHRVARSKFIGEKSRRRVIYIPFISGAYQPKDRSSKTPFYHKLQHLVR